MGQLWWAALFFREKMQFAVGSKVEHSGNQSVVYRAVVAVFGAV
jgi:hypothetical protein